MPGVVSFLDLDPEKFRRGWKRVETDLKRGDKQFEKTDKKAAGLKRTMAGLFAGFSVGVVLNELRKIAGAVIDTGSTFQQLGGAVETAFGDRAAEVFGDIRQFAQDAPSQVAGITASWVGLRGVGIEPTVEAMMDLQDIASGTITASTGQLKTLGDIAEATRAAVGGETEQLKQFNIQAKVRGEEITLIYGDIRRTVRRTGEEVLGVLREISDANFEGAAARQMGFYAGAVSNLDDALDELRAGIFDQGGVGDALTLMVRGTTEYVGAVSPAAIVATREFTGALSEMASVLARGSGGGEAGAGIAARLFAIASGAESGAKQLLAARLVVGDVADIFEDLDANALSAAEALDRLRKVGKIHTEQLGSHAEAGRQVAAIEAEMAELRNRALFSIELINEAKLSKEIEAEAVALDKLLGEMSPGLDILRDFAAEQIEGERATKAAEEAAKEYEKSLAGLLDRMMDLKGFAPRLREELEAVSQIDPLEGSILGGDAPALSDLEPRLRNVGDVIETVHGRIELVSKETMETSFWAGSWAENLGQAAGILQGMIPLLDQIDTGLGDMIAGLARGIDAGIAAFQQTGSVLGGAVAGLAGSGLDFGSSGNAALAGAQAGVPFAAMTGGLSIAVGAFVGLAIDMMEETAQGFQDGAVVAEGLVANMAEGDLSETVGGVMGALQEEFNAILDLVGGQATNFVQLGILIREDAQGARVAIDGVWHQFGEDLEGMMSFAIAELVKRSQIATDRPELQQALQGFAGSTREELQRTLALAFEFETARLGEGAAQVAESVRGIFAKIEEAMAAGIDFEGGIAMLERTRNAILGISDDAVQAKKAEIAAWNAGIKMQELAIRSQIAEIEALGITTQARGETTQAYVMAAEAAINADGARIQSMAAVTGAQAQLVSGSAALLLELQALLDDVLALAIDGAAEAAALARAAANQARRAGRSAGGGGGVTVAPPDFTGPLREELNRMELQGDDAALALFEANLQWAAWQEQLEQSELTMEEVLRFEELFWQSFADQQEAARQAELDAAQQAADDEARIAQQAREGILAPFQAALADDSVAGRFAEINRMTEDAIRELGKLPEILEGSAAMAHQLGNEVRIALDSAASGVMGIIQRALPFIEDPEERERLQQRLVEYEQLIFKLNVMSARIELESIKAQLMLLGQLDPIRAKWIEGMLGDLDIIESNFAAIFEGLGDNIIGAGQTFAQTVGSAASGGGLDAIVAMLMGSLDPTLLPPASPPLSSSQIALMLAQFISSFNDLIDPPGTTSPAQNLMNQLDQLSGFFAAFGLDVIDFQDQIQALIDATGSQATAAQDWASFLSGLANGPQSGNPIGQVVGWFQAQILGLLGAGDAQGAMGLANQAISFLAGQGHQQGAFLDWLQGTAIGSTVSGGGGVGTGTGGGQAGGEVDPFAGLTNRMNVFEINASQRHEASQGTRAMIGETIEQGLQVLGDRVVAAVQGGEREPVKARAFITTQQPRGQRQ